MILLLPYVHPAEVVPWRCRVARKRQVRDYTPVDIREVGQSEVETAFEIVTPNGTLPVERIIVSAEGRLMAPARRKDDGRLLAAVDFVRDHRESLSRSEAFDPRLFPYPNMRHGKRDGDPMRQPTFQQLMAREGWRAAKDIAEEKERHFGDAQAYYASAFLLVDGVLHVECREPVWTVHQRYGGDMGVRLERRADSFWSSDLFRIDRLDAAMEWARRCGADDDPPASTVVPSSLHFIERNDPLEIAKLAIHCGARMWAWDIEPALDADVYARTADSVEGFLDDPASFGPADIPAFLDALSEAYRNAVQKLRSDWGRGDTANIQWCVERWAFESELGLDPRQFEDLCEEDVAALGGLAAVLAA